MAQLQSIEQIEGNVKNILACAEKEQGTKYSFVLDHNENVNREQATASSGEYTA